MPQGQTRRGSTDFLGAITVTAGLAVAVYSIVQASEAGWNSAQTLVGLLVAVALLGTFLGIQANRRAPLVRLGIFRTPTSARPTSHSYSSVPRGFRCGSS